MLHPRARSPSLRLPRRGIALFLMFGLFVVLFLLAFGVASLNRQEVRLTGAFVEGSVAFQIAEAGIEQALFILKEDLEFDRELAKAMVELDSLELRFPAETLTELSALAPPGGLVKAQVWGRYEPLEEVGATGRIGQLVLHSKGKYTNPAGHTAIRQIRVTVPVKGEDLGPVAPEHGLMVRDRRTSNFYVPGFTLDIRDLSVLGGKVYMAGGLTAELTEHLINKRFRPLGDLGLLDIGYNPWNILTLFQGGVDFTHSQLEVGLTQGRLTRKYFDFQGLDKLFGPGPAWMETEEPYRSPVKRTFGEEFYDDERINLRSAEQYRRLASTVVDPKSPNNPRGRPEQNRLFRTVRFGGPLGLRGTSYERVLPLYGWGDWRRMAQMPFQNANRKMDMSAAIQVDGITFVRGDVFLEGWYEGVGTLVVQGNVFLGGDVPGVPPALTGYKSFLNLVVLEDPARETSSRPRLLQNGSRRTGKVLYRPHHDTDFDRRGLLSGRDLDPALDMAIYARNGMEVDRTSLFDKFFNMKIQYNLATDFFELGRLPTDLQIDGLDPKEVFRVNRQMRKYGVSPFFVPILSGAFESWREETPTELAELEEDLDDRP